MASLHILSPARCPQSSVLGLLDGSSRLQETQVAASRPLLPQWAASHWSQPRFEGRGLGTCMPVRGMAKNLWYSLILQRGTGSPYRCPTWRKRASLASRVRQLECQEQGQDEAVTLGRHRARGRRSAGEVRLFFPPGCPCKADFHKLRTGKNHQAAFCPICCFVRVAFECFLVLDWASGPCPSLWD